MVGSAQALDAQGIADRGGVESFGLREGWLVVQVQARAVVVVEYLKASSLAGTVLRDGSTG